MRQLFTLFGKLQRTEEANPDGIGMGLTICQKIIQNCNGKIDVYSEGENKGSTFYFQIPMSQPQELKKTLGNSLLAQLHQQNSEQVQ